jgi:serine-type D-Ala-D-Ala carboxypeptidase/endopeptidase (penicillin-binding protein 4)
MRFLLLILILILPTVTYESAFDAPITTYQQQLKNKFHGHYAILVENTAHRIYFQHNKNDFITPASITKLFTATVALLQLKPNFQYKTSLYTTGQIHNGILKGNVYIRFTGDPTLTSEQLNALLSKLKQQHIQSISGYVYIDATAFDSDYYPKGTTVDDINYNYASPISSIIIDRNAFNLTAHINPHVSPAITFSKPDAPGITYHNKLYLGDTPNCTPTINSNMRNDYTLRGCIENSLKTHSITFPLAIRNPLLLAQNIITTSMHQNGILMQHEINYATTPLKAKFVASQLSPPLSKLINQMLKHSDNLIANSLTKTLGHLQSNIPGSWNDGTALIKKTLRDQAHLNSNDLYFMDGAGLSRYNLTTANTITNLLQFIQKNPILKKYLIPSLPIAGKDGTLIYRMRNLHNNESFKAKTGTLSGVSNLAGYLTTKKDQHFTVVIMADNFTSDAKPIRKIEDSEVTEIAKNK